jgi:hypothetical protein
MIMSIQKPGDLMRSDKSAKSNNRDLSAQQNGAFGRPNDKGAQASSLMERVTLDSTLEIDRLIDDLNKLRRRLEDEGNRVQRDLANHSAFSQSVIQLTQIVSDGVAHVKEISDAPSVIDTKVDIPAFLAAIEPRVG